jgi:hypothetical protein
VLPAWVGRELARAGDDVALVFSTSDYAPGTDRVGFLIVRNDGSLVRAKSARVLVGEADGTPVPGTATLESIVAPGSSSADELDAKELYVSSVGVSKPGRYWMVVQPDGEKIQAVGTLEVKAMSATPAVGALAPASQTPTLADAPAAKITTADPPDRALLRYSVAGSIEQAVPFVLVFATPKFCQSRTCGPTVDVVDAARRKFEADGIRFIHVEIYTDNDPAKGVNRWVSQWRLPTEPFTFVVDRTGVIRAKLEGAFSAAELEAAAKTVVS